MSASYSGNSEVVRMLFDRDASIDLQTKVNASMPTKAA